jgi:hypothetical protein
VAYVVDGFPVPLQSDSRLPNVLRYHAIEVVAAIEGVVARESRNAALTRARDGAACTALRGEIMDEFAKHETQFWERQREAGCRSPWTGRAVPAGRGVEVFELE